MNKKQQIERDFEQLVERQRQTIYSVCYLFADERQQADDLFQETLIRLWQGFDTFEGRSTEKTWVYRISVDYFADASSWDSSEEHNPAAQRLHRRIGKLHPFDRALILLWLEDLPYDEIAAILGITVKNVSVRLVRIREKLKSITD